VLVRQQTLLPSLDLSLDLAHAIESWGSATSDAAASRVFASKASAAFPPADSSPMIPERATVAGISAAPRPSLTARQELGVAGREKVSDTLVYRLL